MHLNIVVQCPSERVAKFHFFQIVSCTLFSSIIGLIQFCMPMYTFACLFLYACAIIDFFLYSIVCRKTNSITAASSKNRKKRNITVNRLCLWNPLLGEVQILSDFMFCSLQAFEDLVTSNNSFEAKRRLNSDCDQFIYGLPEHFNTKIGLSFISHFLSDIATLG